MLLVVHRRRRRCCAAVVVLRSSCVSLLCIPKLCSFTLELGAVHASSHKNLQQFYSYYCCMVPSVVAHFKKTQAKGNVAGATSGASCGPPTSPPLLCCCSCATLIMCVSALYSQVVQFHLGVGSCACILKNLQCYCCVVPVVTDVAHFENRKPS